MKPKSLILIAVAVICGLAAAYFTATVMAGSGKKTKELDLVEVPVAARDIPIGTKIPPKDLEQFFVLKKFPRENVPPNAVQTVEEIGDKRTMRPIRQGETINVADVNAKSFIDPPKGTVLMTTPINLDQSASGFAIPGYKVMVVASKKSQKKNLDIVFPLFSDVLILAVDTNPSAPQVQSNGQSGSSGASGGTGQTGNGATAAGFQSVGMISFAVTPEQSILLAMAAEGCRLRIGLPTQDEGEKTVVVDGYKHLLPTREEMLNIFADKWPEDEKPSEGPKVETVQVRVPTEAIAAGTELTDAVLEKKFKDVEYPKGLLPAGAATTDKELGGKWATADLVPDLLVPKPHLAKDKPKPVEPEVKVITEGVKPSVKVAPEEMVSSPKGFADTSPAEPKKKEFVYVTINTPQGKRVHQYEVTAKGNVFVAELPDVPTDEPKATEPKATKPERKED